MGVLGFDAHLLHGFGGRSAETGRLRIVLLTSLPGQLTRIQRKINAAKAGRGRFVGDAQRTTATAATATAAARCERQCRNDRGMCRGSEPDYVIEIHGTDLFEGELTREWGGRSLVIITLVNCQHFI